MKIVVDLHTHTLLCRHGFSTVTEVIKAASEKGLQGVGLTEHGPGYPGSVPHAYFNTYRDIPRELFGIKVWRGAEVNFMNTKGELDFNDHQLQKLDLSILSCHKECLAPTATEEEIMAMMEVGMKNPYIDIIGHPDNPIYPVNPDELAKMAAKYGKALEINNSSPAARPGSENLCKEIIAAAKKHGAHLSVGSDAHYHLVVGSFDYALGLLEEMDFPEELVINSSMERLEKFLATHHSK